MSPCVNESPDLQESMVWVLVCRLLSLIMISRASRLQKPYDLGECTEYLRAQMCSESEGKNVFRKGI